jgi:hypothetical protein
VCVYKCIPYLACTVDSTCKRSIDDVGTGDGEMAGLGASSYFFPLLDHKLRGGS